MIQDNPLMTLIYSGDYELVVRQQPKEALITQPGKEKSTYLYSHACMFIREIDRSRNRSKANRPTSYRAAESAGGEGPNTVREPRVFARHHMLKSSKVNSCKVPTFS